MSPDRAEARTGWAADSKTLAHSDEPIRAWPEPSARPGQVVSRGDIWLVLPEAVRRIAAEPQPCVILSPPEIHDYLGLVTVAPITAAGNPRPIGCRWSSATDGGVIRLEQIRTIEKRALTRQVGAVEPKTLGTALATLREMFAD